MADLLTLLRAAEPLPIDRRRGVRRSTTHTKRGFVAGKITIPLSNRTALAQHSTRYAELVKAVNAWARKHWPDFRYTTMQINAGDSGLHVDSQNSGPSVIKAVGDFKGGRLWTAERPGELLDLRGRGRRIDGNFPHMTEPSEGERYTIVLFTMRDRTRAPLPQAAYTQYLALGFPPITGRTPPGVIRRDMLPEAAATVKRLHGFTDAAIGDYRNRTLPAYLGRKV
jgi:hypothetical protein